MYMHKYTSACVRRASDPAGAAVAGRELSDMGAGNPTPVLCKEYVPFPAESSPSPIWFVCVW